MAHKRNRSRSGKAMPSDVQMLAGTLADLSAKQLGNNELYFKLFKSQPIVRACVTLIANSVAQEGYDIKPIDENAELDEKDDRVAQIHDFFRIAFIGRFNTFRKAMKALTTDHQTYGVAYLRKHIGRVDGRRALAALERLDARYIIPHLSEDKKSIDYFVQIATKPEVSGPVQQAAQQISSINGQAGERIDPKEIIMISTDDGGDSVLPSPSPLEALDLTCGMDMQVRKHRNAFFENGATMGNVICCVDASDDQVRDAQTKLTLQHVGARRAYKNIAIAGDWKLLNLMQGGKQEIDFIKGTTITTEEIMMVYKVPPGKLRNVVGAMGQAGKAEDDETFEEECILPIEECMYETLTLEILEQEFGISDLRMIPARRNKLRLDRIDAAVKLVKCGGTGNDARDLVGLPKIEKTAEIDMDIPLFLGATGVSGVQSDEATPPPSKQQPNPDDEEGNVTTPNEASDQNKDVDDQTGNAAGTKPKPPKGKAAAWKAESDAYYDKIAKEINDNGGITVSLTGERPSEGFAIGGVSSGGKSLGKIYDGSSFSGKDVQSFMGGDANAALSKDGNFMGGWKGEDGQVHLDPVTVAKASDKEGALSETHARDEIAMYDLGQGKEYFTMSDHERPSASAGHVLTASEQDEKGSGGGDDDGDHWVTINGEHVLIKAGKDKMKAYVAWHARTCRCEVADTGAKGKARARALNYLRNA